MLFRSLQPNVSSQYIFEALSTNLAYVIVVPTDISIWDWLFDSSYSPLKKCPPPIALRGYKNAITGERIDWQQVKDHTTHLSTALVRSYGLEQGQTVALFSPNTIWYPVAMLGTLRAGTRQYRPLSHQFWPFFDK